MRPCGLSVIVTPQPGWAVVDLPKMGAFYTEKEQGPAEMLQKEPFDELLCRLSGITIQSDGVSTAITSLWDNLECCLIAAKSELQISD